MADYNLKQRSDRRAVWAFTDANHPVPTPIQVGVNSGTASILVPLPFPTYTAGGELAALIDADFIINPIGDDGENLDWSIDNFSQDGNGYITFDLINHTAGQQGDLGNFHVTVNLRTTGR